MSQDILDDVLDGTQSDEQEIEKSEPEPRLYAGKFKSEDELEKGYTESQSAMTRSMQEAAELRKRVAELETPRNPQPNYDMDDINSQIIENPFQAVNEIVSRTLAAERQAEAGRKKVLKTFKDDPMFEEVKDDFEEALLLLESSYLIDENQRGIVGENIYNSIVGRHARSGKPKPEPKPEPIPERVARARGVGIGAPDSGTDSGVDISADAKNIMNGFGFTKEEAKQVAKRAAERGE
jgi:bacterioferritin (cytochrome b1)